MSFNRIMNQKSNILNSKPLHFITFSLLFLPLTIFTTLTIQLHFMTSTDITTILTFKTLITLIISSLFIIPPSVTAATALITYTTHQLIHPTETPLTFISTIKSSFFPLLSTILTETLLLSPLALAVLLSFTDVTESLSKAVKFCYLVFLLVYFKGGFGIAAPISVLESKYGFASLWKSHNQLVGLLGKCACYIFINAVCLIGVLLWAVVDFQDSKYMFKWVYAVEVCVVNLLCCLMLLQYVVANTLLHEVACGREEDVVKTVGGNGNEGLDYINVVLYLLFVVLLAHWLSPTYWCSWC